jgi:hypothetical protein
MTTQQATKIFQAINAMEKACLSSDSPRTTIKKIKTMYVQDTRDYFNWLRQQAPMTAMGYDDFDSMIGVVV